MSRLWTWLFSKPTVTYPQNAQVIKAYIETRQVKEFINYLRSKTYQTVCIDVFLTSLPTIDDENYLAELFVAIKEKSRLNSSQLISLLSKKVSRAIIERNFDVCERILRLPLPPVLFPLSSYEITQLIHHCPDQAQVLRCLEKLINHNLIYDSGYVSWILIVLVDTFTPGHEEVINYLLKYQTDKNFLFTNYGENNVTPLMLLLHLAGHEKCQPIIDQYLLDVPDPSLVCRSDRWNRSYLMHLLSGRCPHAISHDLSGVQCNTTAEWIEIFHQSCPNSTSILSIFDRLYRWGNRCEDFFESIYKSDYCVSLKLLFVHYVFDHYPMSMGTKVDQFFEHFAIKLIPQYSHYLESIMPKESFDIALCSVFQSPQFHQNDYFKVIEFLLRHGARVQMDSDITTVIVELLRRNSPSIPCLLLNYSLVIDPSENWSRAVQSIPFDLYMCRLAFCGYRFSTGRLLEKVKSVIPEKKWKVIETFLDLKTPPSLLRSCFQKLRSSVNNLGSETITTLEPHIPRHLQQLMLHLGEREYQKYTRLINQQET